MRSVTETTAYGKIKHLYDFGNCMVKKLYINENKQIAPIGAAPYTKVVYIVVQGRANVLYDQYSTFKGPGALIELNYPTTIINK